MTKTNAGLVEYCKAQLGLPYWYGTFGQKASAALYADKKKQYPEYYTAKDFQSQYGKRVHDCAGLIKGYLWSDTPTSSPKYDPKTDYGATGFYQHCTKKGSLDTFDHVPGRLVFKGKPTEMTHIGVYVGNGEVIEAKGHRYGVIKSKLNSSWSYWGQSNLIKESQTPATPATPTKTDAFKVKTNGSPLALRVAPKKSSALIVWMKNGSHIKVSGTQDGWSRVTYQGKTGWAYSKWIAKV